MAHKKNRLLIMMPLAIYIFVGLSLVGAILRIVGNYFGLMWGLVAVTSFGVIYFIFMYKLARYLGDFSRRE